MIGNRSAIQADAPGGSLLRKYIEYASEYGAIFDWDTADWVYGIPSGQISVTNPDNESESASSDTLSTNNSSKPEPNAVSSDRQPDNPTPWTETELDKTAYTRVEDVFNLSPTTNKELAETWDMIDGREAWNYLMMELSGYFKRNSDQKIEPTSAARELLDS